MNETGTKERTRPVLTFTGGTLDRADPIRTDPERLAKCWADPRARLLLLDGLDPVLGEDGSLATKPIAASAALADHALLGLHADGAPMFISLARAEMSDPPAFQSKTWQIVGDLLPEEAALFGGARSLVDWHRRHQFCAVCGSGTAPVKAGWSRQCGACKAEHFPRVDPVVIMLAEFEGKVLLGRNMRFPPRRFSALAGFIELGETIEEAVRREIFEEAGVRVGRVDYVMSQPWPFPSQLMIGCHAEALGSDLAIDTNELVDAIWVSREEVAAALAGDAGALFLAPPSFAVAHHMLRRWLEG